VPTLAASLFLRRKKSTGFQFSILFAAKPPDRFIHRHVRIANDANLPHAAMLNSEVKTSRSPIERLRQFFTRSLRCSGT